MNTLTSFIGRDPNNELFLQHPSISRSHTRFYFSNDGTTYLYHASTHGTYLNNDQCPTKKCVVIQCKGRIKFGHSTQTYLVLVKKNKNNKHRNHELKEDELLNESEDQNNKIN